VVIPAASWPRTALNVTRVSRMQGRRSSGSGRWKSARTPRPRRTSTDPQPLSAPHLPRPSPFAIELQDLTPSGTSASDRDRHDVIGRAVRAKRYCAGKRILWVDDNPGNNRAFGQFVIKLLNVRIDYALSTMEAMDTLRHHGDHSMVITDMARGADFNAGIDLIKAMKDENLSVPTVIYGSKDSATEGVPPGAFGLTNRPDLLLRYLIDICERDSGA
jgi:CheY-like chemotaxis protein